MRFEHPLLDGAFDRLAMPEATRALILAHHSEPHRHYHTLRHLELMLGQLPETHALAREMIAATLFHDIVYEPARSDNEERSASAFLTAAGTIAPDDRLDADLVHAMILATKSHHFCDEDAPDDAALNILLKADLSILWHPQPQVYAWYAAGVRREYAFVPDDQFRGARAQILTTLRDDILRSGKLSQDEADLLLRNIDWELNRGS